MRYLTKLKDLGMDTVSMYTESVPSRSAAALAYRGIFSLAPLLLVSVLLVSVFVGQEKAEEEISDMVDTVLDEESAEMVEQSVRVMFWSTERDLTLTSLIGLGILLYGASALFKELKIALHSVWGLPPAPKKGMLAYIISQMVAIVMVFLIGFFFLSLIIINVVVSLLDTYAFPGELVSLEWASWFGSLLAMALLIGLMFRLVPDVSLPWSDLWVGALVTAILMMVGIWGINLYFTISDVGSTAGTAGAIVLLLLGSYYAAQVFLFGASFAGAYALNFGSKKAMRELEQFDHPSPEPDSR
ncbi:MAG: YihY/virulence factor BrkB family protein [Anaerolineae bacterium]|nr:YihY/virulence factor BrkB family protein [Anaerolineae bacterium]